ADAGVGVTAGAGVLEVVGAAAAPRGGVATGAGPVADEHRVLGAAVADDDIGVPAAQAVLDVVLVAPPDGRGVDAVAVPVAHEHGVTGSPVGDHPVRRSAG